jgi:dolichyl-phosphate-mannose-protein mannosyltransferase
MKLAAGSEPSIKLTVSRRTQLAIGLLIFLLAFGVRVLTWHDTRPEVGKVQTVVTEDYKRVAQLLRQGGVRGFFSSSSPLADPNNLGHPPGYSILLSLVLSGPGESDALVQFVQIFIDALSAVLIFLIVAELLSTVPAVIAGLLAALSPQLAWNSVLLLPDSLAVFPILLAVYLLALARKKPRFLLFIAAGALVGISCWLRANGMLLTFFVAAAVPLLIKSKNWLRYSLAVVFATCLAVLPLTLRNAIVFHRFIPLSLGAGQTLLEGIADYDTAGRFNIPNTDMGIMKQEAEMFQRSEYYGTLFNPDGVERERARLRRGFGVIGSHPLWFSGVMVRRAASMVRLERARLISINPPVTSPLHLVDQSSIVSSMPSDNLAVTGTKGSAQIKTSLSLDGQTLEIVGDDSKYGTQFILPPASVRARTEYLFKVVTRIEKGRMKIAATDGSGNRHSSAILEPVEGTPPEEQRPNTINLPFTTSNDGEIRLVLSNEASNQAPVVQIHGVRLYELGPVRNAWTRYPRILIHAIQKAIITAVILPLAIIGLAVLIVRKQSVALVILSVVPAYYFLVQSAFHTEYRYVLAVNYFVFAFAAVGISWIGGLVIKKRFPLSLWERGKWRGREA